VKLPTLPASAPLQAASATYNAGMARHESEREDLLREATALVERAELAVAGEHQPVTVGFRKDDSLSVYFGGDPVYQFNAAGQLRRAFAGGMLHKAERGRLVELHRERTAAETVLVRRDLTREQTPAFLTAAIARLTSLQYSLAASDYKVTGQVPAGRDIVSRVRDWLDRHVDSLAIASRPNL
jgi:hypothetical protein